MAIKDNSSIHQIQGTCILVYANTPKPVFNVPNELNWYPEGITETHCQRGINEQYFAIFSFWSEPTHVRIDTPVAAAPGIFEKGVYLYSSDQLFWWGRSLMLKKKLNFFFNVKSPPK